jgi:hypothetical protein
MISEELIDLNFWYFRNSKEIRKFLQRVIHHHSFMKKKKKK